MIYAFKKIKYRVKRLYYFYVTYTIKVSLKACWYNDE